MMRVVVFTSQDISYPVISGLHARGDLALTVVTARTRRDDIYGYRLATELCEELNIPVLLPSSFDGAFLTQMETLAPDLILCAFYPRIFPTRLLRIPPRGCVNVHPGLLPHYRGTFPTPWSILNGEAEFGVTLHYMDEGIDTGDILVQRRFPMKDDETGHELYRRAMTHCAEVMLDAISDLLEGRLTRRRQPAGGSYYNYLPARYHIDWHQTCEHIHRQIRVHAPPYFPAYTFLFNKCLMISRATRAAVADYRAQGPGKIVAVFADGTFVVSCLDGCLHVTEFSWAPATTPEEQRLHLAAGHALTSGRA